MMYMIAGMWMGMQVLASVPDENTAAQAEVLFINDATVEQLASLDGVDQGAAQKIVALRGERGRLSSVEALRVLPEIGSQGLDSLRAHTAVRVQLPIGATETSSRAPLTAEGVLASFSHEPTVQDVHRWTSSYAKTSPHLVERWLKASRNFAGLPQLTLEYRLRDGWDQDFVYLTSSGVGAITPEEEVLPQLSDGGRDKDSYYTVRMRWDLNELVMSSERIRVINEAQDIAKLRDKLLVEATNLYFERRRLQVEMKLAPRSDVLGQVRDQLRLMEVTANLDALTGGAFSAALSRGDASEGGS
jgi:hypothetical protein